MEQNAETTTQKITFEPPVFFAQNSGEGSFAAGCPTNTGDIRSFSANGKMAFTCAMKCKACAVSA